MKGLLLNNYYGAIGNMKLFGVLVAILGAFVLITGNSTAQELFVYITITALPVNSVASMRKDGASKWNQYVLTMPVRRSDIIKSKYLTYLLWAAGGTVLAAAVTGLSLAIHSNLDSFYYGIRDVFSMFILGNGISIIAGSLFYLIAYIVNEEKSEAVLLISVLGSLGITIGAVNSFHKLALSFSVNIGLFVLFYLLLFCLSFVSAMRIYRNKEY